ncbi:hypothetical protein AMATHDRAFT_145074 [Amanita thiersii Skay4041]|uniref:J domain-containing protein n=1 Tax=Amanita thiersii Skay4041 TaxID=703135 RepID=A0A2A9NQ62_9AGAR|nr:hypothetical protein AMATHDRAFT_145074 [Amanita thiersii Skay4041]
MVSSTTQSLLSLIGWAIIPDVLTSNLLRIVHNFLQARTSFPIPQKGTLAYRNHYSNTFALVVLSYLTYTLIQSIRSMPPNFYQLLGVPPTVDEAGLKLAFRQFAKYNHPDRPEVGPAGEELFMLVRDAFEALKNPTVRFAYDRFGPAVLSWKTCSTAGDYLYHGLIQAMVYHIVVGAALLFWSAIGQPSPVSFWRYTLYASLFIAEMALILSPSLYSLSPSLTSLPSSSSFSSNSSSNLFSLLTPTLTPKTLLHTLLPSSYITYQHINLLHQLFLFLSVSLTRVAPHLFPADNNDPRLDIVLLDRINALSALADREASIMVHTTLHTISDSTPEDSSRPTLARMYPSKPPPPTTLVTLAQSIESLIIEANLKKEEVGPLRAACEAALKRMREGGGRGSGSGHVGKEDVKQTPKPFWGGPDAGGDGSGGSVELELDLDLGVVDAVGVHGAGGGVETSMMMESFEDVKSEETEDYPALPSPSPTPPVHADVD